MRLRSICRVPLAFIVALALTGTVAACAKSGNGPPGGTPTLTTTQTLTNTPSSGPTGPVSTGAITEKTVSSCPYIGIDQTTSDAGIRLDRIATLVQGGKVVGCRFYPLEHPNAQCDATCLAGEKLPPGNVPGIEILASQYANAAAAHNAFITIAEKGTGVEQDVFATGNTGLCYKTAVWSDDDGMDVACTFSKGNTVVVIRTVVTGSTLNVVEIAKAVYPKF